MNSEQEINTLADDFLSLYAISAEPSEYWNALETIGSILEKIYQNDGNDQFRPHAEKISKLALLLGKTIKEDASSTIDDAQITFDASGRITKLSDAFKVRFPAYDLENYQDLPIPSDHIKRIRQLLRAQEGSIVAPIYSEADSVNLLCRINCSRQTDKLFLNILDKPLPDSMRQKLFDNFRVTDAEFAVLNALVSGQPASKIAKERGRGLETIRSQIKSLIRKLYAQNQASLVSYALTLASDEGIDTKHDHHLDRSNLVNLNRNTIQYFDFGPRSEKTVLMFYHTTDGPIVSRRVQSELQKSNTRLIVVARPGCGRSSPLLEKDSLSYLRRISEIHRVLLDYIGVEKCRVISNGTGFPFAFVFASLNQDITKSIDAYNPLPPFNTLERCRSMPGRWRHFALSIRTSLKFTEMILALALNSYKLHSKKHAIKMVGDDVRVGISDEHRSDLVETLHRNFLLTSNSNASHFLKEAKLFSLPWEDLIKTDKPLNQVRFIQGTGHFSIPNKVFNELARHFKAEILQLDDRTCDPILHVRPEMIFDDRR